MAQTDGATTEAGASALHPAAAARKVLITDVERYSTPEGNLIVLEGMAQPNALVIVFDRNRVDADVWTDATGHWSASVANLPESHLNFSAATIDPLSGRLDPRGSHADLTVLGEQVVVTINGTVTIHDILPVSSIGL